MPTANDQALARAGGEGAASAPPALGETVIRPQRGWIGIDWGELVRSREILFFLIWRDVKVRYKQTALGIAWAVLQPVFVMIVFTVIFGNLAKIDSEGFPYPVFVYAGLLPWTFFYNAVTLGGQSLVNQQQLLTKVYLPRLFVPAASIGGGLVDLAISFGVYAVLLIAYGVTPGWGLLAVPGLVALTVLTAAGMVFSLSALTVVYRDFRYIVPFLVQALMFLSPVIYPVSLVPDRLQWLLALNPLAGIIDGFRSAILGKPWNPTALGVSAVVALALFCFGLFYFRRTERRFADVA